jgi:hypothetical protein
MAGDAAVVLVLQYLNVRQVTPGTVVTSPWPVTACRAQSSTPARVRLLYQRISDITVFLSKLCFHCNAP